MHPHILANKNPLQVQLQDNKAPKTSPFISYSHLSSLAFFILFSHLIIFFYVFSHLILYCLHCIFCFNPHTLSNCFCVLSFKTHSFCSECLYPFQITLFHLEAFWSPKTQKETTLWINVPYIYFFGIRLSNQALCYSSNFGSWLQLLALAMAMALVFCLLIPIAQKSAH